MTVSECSGVDDIESIITENACSWFTEPPPSESEADDEDSESDDDEGEEDASSPIEPKAEKAEEPTSQHEEVEGVLPVDEL